MDFSRLLTRLFWALRRTSLSSDWYEVFLDGYDFFWALRTRSLTDLLSCSCRGQHVVAYSTVIARDHRTLTRTSSHWKQRQAEDKKTRVRKLRGGSRAGAPRSEIWHRRRQFVHMMHLFRSLRTSTQRETFLHCEVVAPRLQIVRAFGAAIAPVTLSHRLPYK